MADFIQFVLIMFGVFTMGVWFGVTGLKAAQDKEQQRRLEQEWRDWERRHGH